MLTTKEIAEKMRVTTRTVTGWIESGKLVGYKAGRDYRIHEKDFETFLNDIKIKNVSRETITNKNYRMEENKNE